MTALFDEPVRAHLKVADGLEEPCLWVGIIDAKVMLIVRTTGEIETSDKDWVTADWRWTGTKWEDLQDIAPHVATAPEDDDGSPD